MYVSLILEAFLLPHVCEVCPKIWVWVRKCFARNAKTFHRV